MKQNDNPFSNDKTPRQSSSRKSVQRPLNLALFFGATPLVVGVAIYACWRVTGWPWLMEAGAVTFFAGMLFFVTGLVAWWRARTGLRKIPANERGGLSAMVSLALILLMANWPIAFWLAGSAVSTGQATAVTIVNRTTDPLTNVKFSWTSAKGDFGEMKPGSTASKKCQVSFFHYGAIYISYQRGSVKSEIRVTPLARESPRDPVTVTITDDGSVQSSDVQVEEYQLTQHANIDADGHDKIVFDYGMTGTNFVGIARETDGKNKWFEFADQLDKSYDTYIQDARVSIEGDEFHLYCEGHAGKFHERRKLDTGELIERTEELTLVSESNDDESE